MNNPISGIGVDILELDRLLGVDMDAAARYFLTPPEIEEFLRRPDKVQYFASRFCAKEAVIKAYPTRISPHDFMIGKSEGKPVVIFINGAHRYVVAVSLSHSVAFAAGFAVAWEA